MRQLQNSVSHIKRDREMGERYMTLEELIRDEKEEGRQEGRLNISKELICELIEERFGTMPEQLRDKVNRLDKEENLKVLVKKAARVTSFEELEQEVIRLCER